MNTYGKIANELKDYFSSHRIFKLLMPMDYLLVIVSLAIMLLGQFISVGGFLSSASYYTFLLGVLLAYANMNEKYLYGGLSIYAAIDALEFLRYALFVEYRFINYGSLFGIAIFGGLGYLVYKHTLLKGKRKGISA